MWAESIFLFIVVTLTISVTPGPVMLAAMTQGAHFGIRAAHWGMLGATVGHLILMLLASVGLGWLAKLDERVFTFVQCAGAFYLAYLGVRLWWQKNTGQHRRWERAFNAGWLFSFSTIFADILQ